MQVLWLCFLKCLSCKQDIWSLYPSSTSFASPILGNSFSEHTTDSFSGHTLDVKSIEQTIQEEEMYTSRRSGLVCQSAWIKNSISRARIPAGPCLPPGQPGQLSRQSMRLLISGSCVRAPRWALPFLSTHEISKALNKNYKRRKCTQAGAVAQLVKVPFQ